MPFILSGGAGSRLWPVSRESHPKPFIRLADRQSLLQKALLRAAALPDAELVPAALVLAPPADHLLRNQPVLAEAMPRAEDLSVEDCPAALGDSPEASENSNGYLQRDRHMVNRIVKNTDTVRAEAYLEAGIFYWNSGMFCFRATTTVKEPKNHAPDTIKAVAALLSHARRVQGQSYKQVEFNSQSIRLVQEDSIDYAAMRKSHEVAVMPADIGKRDFCSKTALTDLPPHTDHGDRAAGKPLLQDLKGCAHGDEEGTLEGAASVEKPIAGDATDARLIAPRDPKRELKSLFSDVEILTDRAHKPGSSSRRPARTHTAINKGPCFNIIGIVIKRRASHTPHNNCKKIAHRIAASGTACMLNGNC